MDATRLLSLCMIIKDEEQWMEKCLGSICKVADEIIIVDTGSTDRSREICNAFGAKVYDFIWTESFAEARNFGIQQATGEWILWLDADEQIDIVDVAEFMDTLLSSKKDILLIPTINYYGEFPTDINRSYLFASHRLFRNFKNLKFIGNIHEHLNIDEIAINNKVETILSIKIHHYGYMDIVIESKKKYERNLHMLIKEKNKSVYSPWIDYHIASEYYRAKQYDNAFNQVNIAITGFLDKHQFPPSLLYKLKYDILITIGSFEGAWPGIEKAIALYPEYVDLHYYKGIIFYAKEMYDAAILVFRHCLEMGERNIQHLILAGCGGYQAWYFIGMCYEKLGNRSAAIHAYRQTISMYQNHKEAQEKLLQLS